MITNSFDNKSAAKINPIINENAYKLDACILTFSNIIEDYILNNYKCEKIGEIKSGNGIRNIYKIDYKGKKIGFYKTYIGAPAAVAGIEYSFSQIDTKNYIVFGGAGCLNKEITHGKVMIPTEAYRDEGTSYHYKEPSDYIKIKNYKIISKFMEENEIPYIEGKTWTTDAFYRETINNIEKRRNEGCISVEMEASALQALLDFRNKEFYTFFTSGDLLDSPKWDRRHKEGEYEGTQHDTTHFEIVLELADYITRKED